MVENKKIWVLEHYNEPEMVWEPLAYFSSREKAEAYHDILREVEYDIYYDTAEFRYEWHYVDRGYWE